MDSNQIYTPNKSGNILQNDNVAKTYAAYCVIDTDATKNNPYWKDAANGDFRLITPSAIVMLIGVSF